MPSNLYLHKYFGRMGINLKKPKQAPVAAPQNIEMLGYPQAIETKLKKKKNNR